MKRSPSVQLLRLECGGRKIESEQKQGSEIHQSSLEMEANITGGGKYVMAKAGIHA